MKVKGQFFSIRNPNTGDYSTDKPVELSQNLVRQVAKSHNEILSELAQDSTREATGNARYAVTKPSTIPPWVK